MSLGEGSLYSDALPLLTFGDPASDETDRKPRHRAPRRRCLLLCSALVSIAVVLLFTGPALRRRRSGTCYDPYAAQEGYIWRGADPWDIRWIPYSRTLPQKPALGQAKDPSPEAMALAPPAYNEWLAQPDHATDPRLDFLRGKTVVLFGDSHDRKNLESFCLLHPGAVHSSAGGHVRSRCTIPTLNFTLASWFHYGLAEAEESWYMRDSDPAPYGIEERLASHLAADVASIGSPSLLVFNSFYWDLLYFSLHAQHYSLDSSLYSVARAITWTEAQWHQSRLVDLVTALRQAVPSTPLMFRLGQAHATNAQQRNVGVFQLNQSIRHVMKRLGVPVFEWATLLAGEEAYVDDQHFQEGKHPSVLFGNMLLFYLHRAVATSCFEK